MKTSLSTFALLVTVFFLSPFHTAKAQQLTSPAFGIWKGTLINQSNTCGFPKQAPENFTHKVVADSVIAFITDQYGVLHSCLSVGCIQRTAAGMYIRAVNSDYVRLSANTVGLQGMEYIGIRNDRATVRRTLVLYEVNRSGARTGRSCQVIYQGTGRRVSR